MANIPDAHYAYAAFDCTFPALVGLLYRGHHHGSFHFDCAGCGKDAAATAVEKLVVFH